jgi:probable phosphoglycerate mutase
VTKRSIELERADRLRHPVAGETHLYLVRHGQTGSNARRVLCGRGDVPLNGVGIKQAASIAERLHTETRADALVSSPLQRAMTTAWCIGDRVGLEPIPVPGLMEVDFGELDGLTVERLTTEHPDIAQRLADYDDFAVAWPGGESRGEFHGRVIAIFEAILAYYAAHTVIVVAHGGVIGSFLAQIRGLSPNHPSTYDIFNCGLTHLTVSAEQTRIHRFNDVTHLEVLVPGNGSAPSF